MSDSFRKTTQKLVGLSVAEKLRKVFVPCRAGTGGNIVSIKLFDNKNLVGDATDSIDRVRQRLATFFNELDQTPGLPAAVAQNLQLFTFEVTYKRGNPTAAEREAFGMMDFPIYFETTEDGHQPITEKLAEDLFIDHKIPEHTKVKLILPENTVQFRGVKTYDELKDFIKDEDQRQLGMGVPGTYFDDAQRRCRKIGLIKVNLLIRNIVPGQREDRLVLVLKHELGHMFGMDHEANTLMDPSYKDITLHPDYNLNQLTVLSGVLTIISQP